MTEAAANESQLLQVDARTGLAEAEAVDYTKGLCESKRTSALP
jgi:hypothetical protein